MGGTPCPDWSAQSHGDGEEGSDLPATMAWVSLLWQLEEDFWLNENVQRFPPQRILGVLHQKYIVMTAICDLMSFGWPQRRKRRITIWGA